MATKKTAKKTTAKKTAAKKTAAKRAAAKKTVTKTKLVKRHTFEVIEGGDIGEFKVRDDAVGTLYTFERFEDHLGYDDVDILDSPEFVGRSKELFADCLPDGLDDAIRECPASFSARIYVQSQFVVAFAKYLKALGGASVGE